MARSASLLVLLLSLLGCGERGPDADWKIYTQIVQKRPAVAEDLPRCTALADLTLAGDCALSVVLSLTEQDGTGLHMRCGKVPAGVWRAECRFIAAERARSAGKVKLAIRLCEQTDSFASDCAFHLWQRAMRTLAQRIVLQSMAEQQPKMRSLHSRWFERVGHFSGFSAIYWRKLFRAIWDGVYLIDPDICSQLDPDIEPHCLLGARIHLDHAIRASLREESWKQHFCAGTAPSVAELKHIPGGFPELDRFGDHPAHQAVLTEFHAQACADLPMPKHPDPPRRKLTERERPAQDRTAPSTQSK
jgi:hypothetical protein